jgi:hypothetical protein
MYTATGFTVNRAKFTAGPFIKVKVGLNKRSCPKTDWREFEVIIWGEKLNYCTSVIIRILLYCVYSMMGRKK